MNESRLQSKEYQMGANIVVVARVIDVRFKGSGQNEVTLDYIYEPHGRFPRNTEPQSYFPKKITIVNGVIFKGREVTLELAVSGSQPGSMTCTVRKCRAGAQEFTVRN
jgi:hypothetical protein